MITISEIRASSKSSKNIIGELRGLSTDEKPTQIEGNQITNGCVFIEMDTGKIYFYDLSNTSWIEFGGGVVPPTPVETYTITFSYIRDGEYITITDSVMGTLKNADTDEEVRSYDGSAPTEENLPNGNYRLHLDIMDEASTEINKDFTVSDSDDEVIITLPTESNE